MISKEASEKLFDGLLKISPLNHENHADWFIKVENYLILNDLWRCVEVDEQETDRSSRAANLKTLAILKALVNDVTSKELNKCETAESGWNYLKSYYQNKIDNEDIRWLNKIDNFELSRDKNLLVNFEQFNSLFTKLRKIKTLEDYKLAKFCSKLKQDHLVQRLLSAPNEQQYRNILTKNDNQSNNQRHSNSSHDVDSQSIKSLTTQNQRRNEDRSVSNYSRQDNNQRQNNTSNQKQNNNQRHGNNNNNNQRHGNNNNNNNQRQGNNNNNNNNQRQGNNNSNNNQRQGNNNNNNQRQGNNNSNNNQRQGNNNNSNQRYNNNSYTNQSNDVDNQSVRRWRQNNNREDNNNQSDNNYQRRQTPNYLNYQENENNFIENGIINEFVKENEKKYVNKKTEVTNQCGESSASDWDDDFEDNPPVKLNRTDNSNRPNNSFGENNQTESIGYQRKKSDQTRGIMRTSSKDNLNQTDYDRRYK